MRALIVVLALTLAALILRSVGLQFGLPAVYNPDEVAILARALTFRRARSTRTTSFPDLLFLRAVCVARCLPRLRVRVRPGVVARGIAAVRTSPIPPDSTPRAAPSASLGRGNRAFSSNDWALRSSTGARGLAAAIFMAAAPLSVRDSHYVKHDVFATMLIVAAYVAIVRVWPGPRAVVSPA